MDVLVKLHRSFTDTIPSILKIFIILGGQFFNLFFNSDLFDGYL